MACGAIAFSLIFFGAGPIAIDGCGGARGGRQTNAFKVSQFRLLRCRVRCSAPPCAVRTASNSGELWPARSRAALRSSKLSQVVLITQEALPAART